MSDEDRECVDGAFDEDLLRRMLVTDVRRRAMKAFEQDEEIMSDLFAVFSECPGAAPD